MRAALLILASLVFALAAPHASALAGGSAPPPYVVIVNPGNPLGAASRKFVSDAFLKKTTRWPSGDVIRPVDLPPDSAVREKFSDEIHQRSVAAVRSYWQQMIFAGRDVPPPELGSEDEVIKYVLKNGGAIGYVSGAASLNGAKVLDVQ